MPSVSEAQRRYIYAHFGPDWAKLHHFDNKGKLPSRARVNKKKRKPPKRIRHRT